MRQAPGGTSPAAHGSCALRHWERVNSARHGHIHTLYYTAELHAVTTASHAELVFLCGGQHLDLARLGRACVRGCTDGVR
jgi:hypothetical protein